MARVSDSLIVSRRLSSLLPSAQSWWRCCAGSTSTPFLSPRCRRSNCICRTRYIFALFTQRAYWPYLAIIIPLAALDTLGSLMILESVKVAGDDYATKPSLLMNGLGTITAACLGSPFPTTLYLGHAAHKANGARSGYSVLNGLVTLLLCTTGILPVVLRFVPLEVAAPVIIWFGLITVAQAVVEVPPTQAIAVIIGLIPALSQWATGIADTVARKAGSSLMEVAPRMGGDLAMGGLIALGQGSLLTSMLWSAALALIIQRRFVSATAWLAAAAAFPQSALSMPIRSPPTAWKAESGGGSRPSSPLPTRPAQPSHWRAPGIRIPGKLNISTRKRSQ